MPGSIAGAITARPLGADEVRTAYERLGRKAASTAPRGTARTCPHAAAGRAASDAATTLPTGVDGTVRCITYRYDGAEQGVTSLTRNAARCCNELYVYRMRLCRAGAPPVAGPQARPYQRAAIPPTMQ